VELPNKPKGMPLLTHSRQDTFKTCRKKHFFSYEIGLRRTTDAKALRMGSGFHNGVECLGKGGSIEEACEAVRRCYTRMPDEFDQHELAIEIETVLRLVCAYQWRWQNDNLEYVEVEKSFELPLVNPETGKRTSSFNLAGKIDGIVKLEDRRLAVKETKLFGDDIGQDSDLWRRMRIDHQVSLYMHAAREMGYAVETVLYDVARKPTIKPTAVPLLDSEGRKVVLDAQRMRVKTKDGKKWRESGDAAQGFVLETRPMTVEEWGEKLSADIVERPDFYFQRIEVPRLDQDLAEYQSELWEIQQAIRTAQKSGHWFRTVNKNTCDFCSYFGICTSGVTVGTEAPEGFEFVTDLHPELERIHVRSAPESTAEVSAPTTVCEPEPACG
jgi:CRISPR/Cas system-associated exonuclease Cas4 (RecB family)